MVSVFGYYTTAEYCNWLQIGVDISKNKFRNGPSIKFCFGFLASSVWVLQIVGWKFYKLQRVKVFFFFFLQSSLRTVNSQGTFYWNNRVLMIFKSSSLMCEQWVTVCARMLCQKVQSTATNQFLFRMNDNWFQKYSNIVMEGKTSSEWVPFLWY